MTIPSFTEHCANCGIPFEVTQDFHDRRVKDKQSFYCPSGHSQSYRGETEEARLKRLLADANGRIERMDKKLPKRYRGTI